MKVLVFGSGGQLGQVLRRTTPYRDAIFLDRAAVDLCDRGAIERALHAARPELVINAAAYNAVDRAESETDLAHAINELAPATMASACSALGARFIHLSTDYVFDGAISRPYRPDDVANPRNAYGRSKLAGERQVHAAGAAHLVIRTAWVYSEVGRNFLPTILERARTQPRLRVVTDQVGSPTSAWSLADAIWRAARRADCVGTVHFTDGAELSRYDFVAAILGAAATRGLLPMRVVVEAVSAAQFAAENPATAVRPAYSVLDSNGLRRQLDMRDTDWKEALHAVMNRYVASNG